MDDRLIRTLDFCKTADGFLVTDYTGNYRYHVLDQRGKIIQSVGHVPSEKNVDDSDKPALSQAWRSFMDYNPKNGVLAIVTQLGEVVELFNLKTGEHKVYYGPRGEPVFSTLSSEAIPKGIKGFNDVVVSDSCIYTILMVHHSKTVLIRCGQAINFQQEAIIFMYSDLMAVHWRKCQQNVLLLVLSL